MATLLLEIFSEEIPARMQAEASRYLQASLEDALKANALAYAKVQAFVTPRRVAVMLHDIPAMQQDVTIEKKGPKTSAPQAALDGFLKSSGLKLEQLEKRLVGKDETYFGVVEQKGQPTTAILKTAIEKILGDFPWPKSMRWGSGETRWVRPLHSILCVFDGKIVPLAFAGIKAGNQTFGHRFLAPQAITISDPEQYEAALKKVYVIADASARKEEIKTQADALAAKHGLQVKRDDGLLSEVTGLVEWPTLLLGSIDQKFMDLPPEVLISEMRAHQKYFALLGKDESFSDKFLITSNMITNDGGKAVIAGNERVLRARLSDGRFFWDLDRKTKLEDWAKKLSGVTFHAKIGTIADKVERVKTLAVKIADAVKADKKLVERAAMLSKADLVTGMVGEFPDLQGVMGRYYATAQKEDASVADAIRDHYLPLGPDSPVPTKPVSISIALADKFDTLISMFAAGEKPTGSKDPFALRRSALGIIRIILENNLRLPLKTFLNDELIAFFADRLKVMLKDQSIRHDVITAVIAGGDDDLVRVVARAKALQAFLGSDDGANLLAAYKRASNIVGIEEKKDKTTYKGEVDAKHVRQDEEKALLETLTRITPEVEKTLGSEQYEKAMGSLAQLRKPVDAFFDKVMVNDEDKALRTNRLNLLTRIRTTMDKIADFNNIEG